MSESILYKCRACGYVSQVPRELRGIELKCDECGQPGKAPRELPSLRRRALARAREDESRPAIPPLALLIATVISAGAGYAWYELELNSMSGHTWLAILTGVAIGAVFGRLGARPGKVWWIAFLLTVAPFVAAKFKLTEWDRVGHADEHMRAMDENGALDSLYRSRHGIQDPLAPIPEDAYWDWIREYREGVTASYPSSELLLERLGAGEVLLLLLSGGAALITLSKVGRPPG